MIEVRDFEPAHLALITPQPGQQIEVNADSLAGFFGRGWTGFVGDRVVVCAGLIDVWPGRAYAWALLSADAGPHLLSITREIRSRLAATPCRRIEMAVDASFEPGRRWAVRLGFRLENPEGEPMRAYLPNGRDAYLYART